MWKKYEEPISTIVILSLSFGRAGNVNNTGSMQKAVVPKNWTMSQAQPHPAAHLVVNDPRHDSQDKGKILLCFDSYIPENKKPTIPGIGFEFCGYVFPPIKVPVPRAKENHFLEGMEKVPPFDFLSGKVSATLIVGSSSRGLIAM